MMTEENRFGDGSVVSGEFYQTIVNPDFSTELV
jgi:hypothetical protein